MFSVDDCDSMLLDLQQSNQGGYMKLLIKVALLVSSTVILSACIPTSTGVKGENIIGNPGSPLWFDTASQATIINHYKNVCIAYGFIDGTPEMAKCIQDAHAEGKHGARERIKAVNKINSYNKPITCTTFGNTTTCR